MSNLRLGINIDHVATLRNARGTVHPDPIRAALLAEEAGADGITVHLREDRRHIIDRDLERLNEALSIPINMECAATEEMLAIALKVRPHACCIVPERREELTTEGGLDVIGKKMHLLPMISRLRAANIRVSLFVDPDNMQLEAARELSADCVELHTGRYCHSHGTESKKELHKLAHSAEFASTLGLECHAGHGLNYENVGPVAAIPQLVELNIGHFLMGEALFVGLKESIQHMRRIMDEARS